MKGFSNSTTEKPLSCNVKGCSLKFNSKDHLLGHKKTHDMTLNIDSAKGTCMDQTPTPTQFIKNCEEVGLFQDLQNVNPFEETFKKAAEAVRSGQPINSKNSSLPQSSDDSLHTPNIFPDIPQVLNVKQEVEWEEHENLEQAEDNLLEDAISKQGLKKEPAHITNQPILETSINHAKSAISHKNLVAGDQLSPNKVFINVPVPVPVQFISAGNSQPPCNVVLVQNSNALYPVPVKEKLKQNLGDKNSDNKAIQHKVPISKCPAKRNTMSLSSKFSNFSKNALKYMSKLNTSTLQTENQETNPPPKKKQRIQKTVPDIFSKEARIEFLARSRAASSRSREKKKMYILYLEKVNSELTTKNQNLSLVNVALRKHLKALQTELSRHKACNVADKDTEAVLAKAEKLMADSKTVKNEKQVLVTFINPQPQPVAVLSAPIGASTPLLALQPAEDSSFSHLDFSNFQVSEVTVGGRLEDDEIPLNSSSTMCSPGTITKFNSVSNVSPADFPPDSYLGLTVENIPENAKTILAEHSYFLKKPNLDVDRQLGTLKKFKETLSASSKPNNSLKSRGRSKRNVGPKDATISRKKNDSDAKSPPPPVSLKPFKKRKLQKRNKCEKT